jgi:membrane protein DedA with SNARE-associated domain
MDIINYLSGYRYLAFFGGAFIEGPIAMAAGGFFLRLGLVNIFLTYFALVFGDLAADIMWYYVGYFGADNLIKRFGHFFSIDQEIIAKLKVFFRKHENKILVISKVTMGLGFSMATLLTAGMSRVSIKKFIAFNFIGGLIWTAFLMVLGYVFGNIYLVIETGTRDIFLAGIVIIIVGVLAGFGKYMRNRLIKNNL